MIVFVPGTPRPQGSHRAFVMRGRDGKPHARVTSDNPKTKPWRRAVAEAALGFQRSRFDADQPARLLCVFALRRPKSHLGKRGLTAAGRAKLWPTSKPDTDKLLRAIGDALKGTLYHDDTDLVDVLGAKRWTTLAEGAYIALVSPAGVAWRHPCDMLHRFGVVELNGTLHGQPHGVAPLEPPWPTREELVEYARGEQPA